MSKLFTRRLIILKKQELWTSDRLAFTKTKKYTNCSNDNDLSHKILIISRLIKVKSIRVEKRINDIVNRLNKTKIERKPDLRVRVEVKYFLNFECESSFMKRLNVRNVIERNERTKRDFCVNKKRSKKRKKSVKKSSTNSSNSKFYQII